MMDILNTFGASAVKLIVWVIFAIIGFGLKKIATRVLNTKEKRQLANDVVTFVEQKYKDLHGEEKFNKAVEAFTDILTERGIKTSDEVVATIASMAASEVSGVYNMSGGFVGGISEMLGKKTKGIKVQVGEKETVIDISLIVEYGARIPDIAWEVQNKVKTQVESMTGLNVVAVNVHVQGVNLPKENKKSMEKKVEEEKKTEEVKNEE